MYKCKRCKKPLCFDKNIKYKIVDIEEVFSKYLFNVKVKVVCDKCKREYTKEYAFCINCLTLSSTEIEKEIEKRIKKKLRLI